MFTDGVGVAEGLAVLPKAVVGAPFEKHVGASSKQRRQFNLIGRIADLDQIIPLTTLPFCSGMLPTASNISESVTGMALRPQGS